jgi:uncharacterized protein (DUF433 family)
MTGEEVVPVDDRYIEMLSSDDIRVTGTRVGIEHLLSAYLAGSLPEEIAVAFPTVTLEQVHGVIAYYLRNRTEIDAYLTRWRTRARQARTMQEQCESPRVVQRLRQLAMERVAK